MVYDGRVFVNFDQDRLDYKNRAEIPEQEHATAILAFDAATGKPLWRRERKGQYACYSVPMMRDTAAGGRELIVMNTHALRFAVTMRGVIDASTTRSADTPRTRP